MRSMERIDDPSQSRVRIWARLAKDLDLTRLDAMTGHAVLGDVPALGEAILKGEVRGRIVVDVNR